MTKPLLSDEEREDLDEARSLSPTELRGKSKMHYSFARSMVRYAGMAKESLHNDYRLPRSPMGLLQAPTEASNPKFAEAVRYQYERVIPADLHEAKKERWLARRYRKMAEQKEARAKRTRHVRSR